MHTSPLSQETKIKKFLPLRVSNVTSRQNSQTVHKIQPNFLSVSFLPET